MFDTYCGEIDLTSLALTASIVIFLPVQLLLCFKVKRRLVRLLPVLVLSVLTAVFFFLAFSNKGWEALGYVFLAFYVGLMALACGAGWGVWAIIGLIRRRGK